MEDNEQVTEPAEQYRVLSPSSKALLDSEDIFKCLDMLKRQPPGAKLIRVRDKKTLAYTTAPKFDFDDSNDDPRRRRKQTE